MPSSLSCFSGGSRNFLSHFLKEACNGEWKLISAIHNLHKLRGHEERLKKTALPDALTAKK